MENKIIRKIVEGALSQYADHYHKIEFFAKETSHIYRVYNSENECFALKIHNQSSDTFEDHLVEAFLLENIQEKSEVLIPQIIFSKTGESSVKIYEEQDDITYRVSMTKWIESKPLKGNETKGIFIELGRTVARLHKATQSLSIPTHLSPKKWNKVFYFRKEKVVYKEDRYRHLLNGEFIDLLDQLIPYLDHQLYKRYKNNTPQLIHADLNPWNVRLNQGKIAILDFEDSVLGSPIQDIATLLYYYKTEEEFSYQQVLEYFIQGYSQIRELPDFSEPDFELYFTARQINFLNYALTLGDDYQEFVLNSIVPIKAFGDRYL